MNRSHTTTCHMAQPPAAMRGFTLIELMIVVAIVVALAGILVVGVTQARKTAQSVATEQFLSAIAVGLDSFERDLNQFPPSEIDNGASPMDDWEGGEILTQAMLGHLPEEDDGVPGQGFKTNPTGARSGEFSTTGRTYGPYVELPNDDSLAEGPNWQDDERSFVFNTGSAEEIAPVLYYRNRGTRDSGNLTETPAIWGDHDDSRYRIEHNEELLGGDGSVILNYWLTDEADGGPTDEEIEELERSLRSAKFLLVAPGPDDIFGTEDDVLLPGS